MSKEFQLEAFERVHGAPAKSEERGEAGERRLCGSPYAARLPASRLSQPVLDDPHRQTWLAIFEQTFFFVKRLNGAAPASENRHEAEGALGDASFHEFMAMVIEAGLKRGA
jgi:hypothetical protein